jgi:cytochrome c oxidase cbb3-type subunit 2
MTRQLLVPSVMLLLCGLAGYRFGQPPAAAAQVSSTTGQKIYLESCAACHGAQGDGKGPEADRLKIKPRDFTGGIYKFRSTPSGSLPLDRDIFRSISQGIRITSMLPQLHLTEKERWAVTEHLKTFSERFKTEKPRKPIAVPAAPQRDRELVPLGKQLYMDAGCPQCHGADGKGDGESAKELRDDWGRPISPTDLTLRAFKSGPGPADLYRTISTGLNGTPMPSYGDVLSEKQRWAVVHYLLSIATRERPRGMMGLIGEEVQGMRIDMRAAMAGMMGGRGGMMGGQGRMMDRHRDDVMQDRTRR